MRREAGPTTRTALRAAKVLEVSPIVAAGSLLVAFLIGAASASLTPTLSGIDGFAPIANGALAGVLAMTVLQSVILLMVGFAAIVLVRDASQTGPSRGWGRATIAGSIASGALIVARGALALTTEDHWLDSPGMPPWTVSVSWGTRIVGVSTLAGLVMVLRARGSLPRWGLPLIAACLATPIIHVLGIPMLEATVYFLLICAIGTAWRLHLAAETPDTAMPAAVVIAPR